VGEKPVMDLTPNQVDCIIAVAAWGVLGISFLVAILASVYHERH
jgi:hypothetical protein